MLNNTTVPDRGTPIFSITQLLLILILVRPTLDMWADVSLIPGTRYTSLNVAALFSIIVLATFLYSTIKRTLGSKSIYRKRSQISKPFFIFVIYSIMVSIFVSADKALAGADTLRLFTIYAFYLLCYRYINNETKAMLFTKYFLWSSIIPMAMGMSQFSNGESAEILNLFSRINGTFVNPVQFGHYLAIMSLLAVVMWIYSERKIRRQILIYVTFSLFCLIMTYTRGAWIGFIAGIFGLILLTKSLSRKSLIIIILSLTILMAVIFLPNIKTLLISSFDIENPELSSVASRIYIWKKALLAFIEKPWLGHGLRQSYIILNIEPHNDYLRVLLELGVIGLLQFLWIIYLMLSNTYIAIKHSIPHTFINKLSTAFFCMYLAYLVMSISDNLFTSLVIQYPVWGFAAIIHRNTQLQLKS
jgi:putative inorganic carbon (hco3(-)) transporter